MNFTNNNNTSEGYSHRRDSLMVLVNNQRRKSSVVLETEFRHTMIVRAKVLEAVEEEANLFDAQDVCKLVNDSQFISRHAKDRSPEEAAEFIIAKLKWRNSERISQLNDTLFPAELYQLGSCFKYRWTKKREQVLYIREKYCIKHKSLAPLMKLHLTHLLSSLDNDANANGIVLIMDMSGVRVRKFDSELLFFLLKIIKSYFPHLINGLYIVDCSILLRSALFLLLKLAPNRQLRSIEFISRHKLLEFIDHENLPDFMKGSCSEPYKGTAMAPARCITLREYCDQNGISHWKFLEICNEVESYLREEAIPPEASPTSRSK